MGPAKAANYCKQMQSNVRIHKAATAYQEALKDNTEAQAERNTPSYQWKNVSSRQGHF